jgi:hypothetical protein
MNIKKLDDKEVVFIDQPWTSQEKELFSELLRKRKEKKSAKQKIFTSGIVKPSALHIH